MFLINSDTKLVCKDRTCISGVGCETGLIAAFGGNLEIGSKVFAINQGSGQEDKVKIGQIEKAEIPLYFVKTNQDVSLLPEISFANAGGIPAQVDMKVKIDSEEFSIVRIDTDNGAFYLQPKKVDVPLGSIVRTQSNNMVGIVTGHTEDSIECMDIFEAMHLLTEMPLKSASGATEKERALDEVLRKVVQPLPKQPTPKSENENDTTEKFKELINEKRREIGMDKNIKVKVTYTDGTVREITFPMETDPEVIKLLVKATEAEQMGAGIQR